MLCDWNLPSGSREEIENVKSLRQIKTKTTTPMLFTNFDLKIQKINNSYIDGQRENFDKKSSLKPFAQVSLSVGPIHTCSRGVGM